MGVFLWVIANVNRVRKRGQLHKDITTADTKKLTIACHPGNGKNTNIPRIKLRPIAKIGKPLRFNKAKNGGK